MSEPTLELTAYAANCHCGAVRLTVNIPSLTDHKVMSCNCSLCTRNGYLNVYAERKDVIFHSGADNLSTYPIQNMNAHKFCSTCGSSMIAEALGEVSDGEPDIISINVSNPHDDEPNLFTCNDGSCQVRMIKDIDVDKLQLKYYDGRSAKPEYDIGKPPMGSDFSAIPTTDPDLTQYPANCHCGAVRYNVRIPSLTDHTVNKCNCSICTRNGYLLVYPEQKMVIFHTGYDHLHSYTFGAKRRTHKFCPTCGSSVLIDFNGIYEGKDTLGINVSIYQFIPGVSS